MRAKIVSVSLLLSLLTLAGCGLFDRPPKAERIPVSDTLFGDERTDPYAWLRDRDSERVTAYLEAENAYTERKMKSTLALQDSLYQEMVERIEENDESVPVRDGAWYYFQQEREGLDYPISMRKPVTGGESETILDENQRAEGEEYYRLGLFEVSPNGKILAFAEDTRGRELYTLRFKNLATGELYDDRVDSVYYSGAWANDNRSFFYVTVDAALRPFRVWRHVLGTNSQEDQLVFEESDEKFGVNLDKSRDDRFVFINSSSTLTSEVLYLPAWVPQASFRPVLERSQGVEYHVGHRKGFFFVMTNEDGAENFKLVKIRTSSLAEKRFTEVVAHREDVLLHGFDLFEDFLVLYERKDATKRVRIHKFAPSSDHFVEFPEEVYGVWAGDNPQFSTDSLRLVYSSFITPRSIYDYHMGDRQLTLLKRDEVGGDFDPSRYHVQRLMAPARDGELIPVSLVEPVDTPHDGTAPMLVYGYGSYGATMDPSFRSTRLNLLERGWVFAIAHVRGSQAKGRQWYERGKFLEKKNTFNDFIDVTIYLQRRGFSSPEATAAKGGSAGGLLVGAVANERPELYRAMVAHVPFVDVLNTMLDESIPLTVGEFEEWGNPKEEEYYHYIKSYSPYDNIVEQDYPAMLITAGINDPRVQYWEPAKWTARLRATKSDNNLLLLKTNMGAGHGGASGRYSALEEKAFEQAFLLEQVGRR